MHIMPLEPSTGALTAMGSFPARARFLMILERLWPILHWLSSQRVALPGHVSFLSTCAPASFVQNPGNILGSGTRVQDASTNCLGTGMAKWNIRPCGQKKWLCLAMNPLPRGLTPLQIPLRRAHGVDFNAHRFLRRSWRHLGLVLGFSVDAKR